MKKKVEPAPGWDGAAGRTRRGQVRRRITCCVRKRECRPGYRALAPERLFVSDSDGAVFFVSLAERDLVSGFASDLLVLSFFIDFTEPLHDQ